MRTRPRNPRPQRPRGRRHPRPLRTAPAPGEDTERLQREYEKEVFQQAAGLIRPSFSETTWEAFWRTAVDGEDCQAVADELGLSLGSVYAARCRVIRKLNEKVRSLEF